MYTYISIYKIIYIVPPLDGRGERGESNRAKILACLQKRKK